MIAIVLLIISALLIPGIINRTRSILSGRKGPGILQPLYNLQLLFKKGAVYSHNSGRVFKYAPVVSFAAVITALLMVPFGKFQPIISFSGNFVMFAYLLALSRFAMILGALDTSSSFEGMGAAREALYGMLIEPALFMLLGTLAMLTGFSSFSEIFDNFSTENLNMLIPGTLAFIAFICMMLVETGRLPVDDPRTHLELTMVHEVMILDYSGFDLALIHLTNYLKAAIFAALAALCILPSGLILGIYMPVFLAIVFIIAVIIAVFESFRARNPLISNPAYILTIAAMAFIAFVTAAIV